MSCLGLAAAPGTKLRAAAVEGDLNALRAELEKWPAKHPDLPDVGGETALILAAHEGQLEVVCCLLNVGADPNAKTKDGRTALICAAARGHLHIVRALLLKGADVEARTKRDGLTALILAAGAGHEDTVRFLLRGTAADAPSKAGLTAIMVASQAGHAGVVRHLVAAGADPYASYDASGVCAVSLAPSYEVRRALEGFPEDKLKPAREVVPEGPHVPPPADFGHWSPDLAKEEALRAAEEEAAARVWVAAPSPIGLNQQSLPFYKDATTLVGAWYTPESARRELTLQQRLQGWAGTEGVEYRTDTTGLVATPEGVVLALTPGRRSAFKEARRAGAVGAAERWESPGTLEPGSDLIPEQQLDTPSGKGGAVGGGGGRSSAEVRGPQTGRW